MDDVISGFITGVTLTVFFYVIERISYCIKHLKDVARIRDIVTRARKHIIEYKDTYHEGMGTELDSDFLRACRYNTMVKELEGLFSTGKVHISHTKKKDIFDALDWYNTNGLNIIQTDRGDVLCSDLPNGKWPTKTMQMKFVLEKFGKLASIKWLKMKPYTKAL